MPLALLVLLKLFNTLATVQLSPVAGTAIVTAAVQTPPSVSWVTFDGQVIVGFWVSIIVTVNEHVLFTFV